MFTDTHNDGYDYIYFLIAFRYSLSIQRESYGWGLNRKCVQANGEIN